MLQPSAVFIRVVIVVVIIAVVAVVAIIAVAAGGIIAVAAGVIPFSTQRNCLTFALERGLILCRRPLPQSIGYKKYPPSNAANASNEPVTTTARLIVFLILTGFGAALPHQTQADRQGGHAANPLVLQRRISKCDVWPFVFGHERAIAVGSWQYVVRFKLVTKTTLPDKLSL